MQKWIYCLALLTTLVLITGCGARYTFNGETFTSSSEALQKQSEILSQVIDNIKPTENPVHGNALVLIPSNVEIQKNYTRFGNNASRLENEQIDYMIAGTANSYLFVVETIRKRAIFDSVTMARHDGNPAMFPFGNYDFLVFADVDGWFMKGKNNQGHYKFYSIITIPTLAQIVLILIHSISKRLKLTADEDMFNWCIKEFKMKKIASAKIRVFCSFLAPLLRISLCIVPGLLLISCASLPKETYLNNTCLTSIKKVVIVTSVSAPEVSYSIYNTSIPGGLAGFFASCIEGAIRSGVDHAHAVKISEHSDYSRNESKMAQSFIQVLKKGNYFHVIDYANNDNNRDESKLSNTGYDAVIRLIVQEILLEKTAAEYMSFTARVRGELENLKSREILWTREERVINPEPHTLDYYKENGLKELDAMLEKAGKNLAYDFLYLK